MKVLRDMPIKRKVTWVIMLSSMLSLALVTAGIFAFQWANFRGMIMRDLLAQSLIIAQNSRAAVSFEDKQAATEILESLAAKPNIAGAALYRTDGTKIAAWTAKGRADAEVIPDHPPSQGFHFQEPYYFLAQPVRLEGRRIGILLLSFDFNAMRREILMPQLSLTAGSVLAAALVAIMLSSAFQRVISRPILNLAGTARAVAEKKDFSVRATHEGRDELGLLTDAFNRMLDQIQANDRAMRHANRNLQAEIAERRRTENELRDSRLRFEIAVAGANDGIWDWDLETGQIYFSPRWKGMIGYEGGAFADSVQEWEEHLHPEDREAFRKTTQDCLQGRAAKYQTEFRLRHADGSYRWILSRGAVIHDESGKAVRFAGSHTDVSDRKAAEAELARLNEELVENSRRAGMVELANGVLHNVGNVLNSANVSADIVKQRARTTNVENLGRAVALIRENFADIGNYLHNDPKGKLIPDYLDKLARLLQDNKKRMIEEVDELDKNIEHIKDIITTQQSYATFGAVESLPIAGLIEDALRMNSGGFARRGVVIHRHYQETPPVTVMKPKVMQILINLFRNANQAMDAADITEKSLAVRVSLNDQRVRVSVSDNGIGIPSENLGRIFGHGFTTKTDGHGFGLHSCLLAAREMNGDLLVESDGPGRGATFILELPLTKPKSLAA